jgi:hypothetical protein
MDLLSLYITLGCLELHEWLYIQITSQASIHSHAEFVTKHLCST